MIKTISLLLIFMLICSSAAAEENSPQRLILDTDISSDVDDVGAVAVLHALADQGKAEILGMMVSSGDPYGGLCLEALNGWFGRPEIPVGAIRGKSVTHKSKYTRQIALEYHPDQDQKTDRAEAVTLYRKLLSTQPDNSVTIISVGYLSNLSNLLNSQPDSISELNGTDLVRKKVRQLVSMGGKYPSGREWNFYHDTKSAANVINRWPAPILFVGYESGVSVLTGSRLNQTAGPNPVSSAYELYNGLTDRPSWDQLAVLFGVLSREPLTGVPGLFEVRRGTNTIASDGSNNWVYREDGPHAYIVNAQFSDGLKKIIEDMMIAAVKQAFRLIR